jgi:hypothetical protein
MLATAKTARLIGSAASAHSGVGVDVGAGAGVVVFEAVEAAGRRAQDGLDGEAVGVAQAGRCVVMEFDGEAAFVHESVVVVAEQQEVVEAGLAAVGPVPDVVGGEEARVRAAGELADSPSRAVSARRSAGGMERVLRPTESGIPSASTTVTSDASQASRCVVSGESAGPLST